MKTASLQQSLFRMSRLLLSRVNQLRLPPLADKLLRHRLGRVGFAVLFITLFCAVFADILTPYDPAQIDYRAVLQPPSWTHWFGTDELGRDVLTRIIHGSRVSLSVVVVSVGAALFVGSFVGFISAWVGGRTDAAIMRVMDALLAFPMIVLALGIIAALGPSLSSAMVALAIVNIPGFARLVRVQAMSIKTTDYVQAAKTIGASDGQIIFRHIMPNLIGPVVIYASLKASAALITESALSFLGLGSQPPTPTWGNMLSVAIGYWDQWWLSIAPGLAIFVVVLGFNFAGDALRDAFDNKLAE